MLVFLALALAQTAAAPPAVAPSGPPPEFIAAAQGFGECLKGSTAKVPATATPEDGATQALAACAAQRTELDARFTGWVNGPTFPEAGRAMALQSYRAEMDKLPLEVADTLKQKRATAAPAAGAAPTPAPGK